MREAYQSVAVVQRRDPLLVTSCGQNRVMLQCFPVPAKGTIKTKIGVSAPLRLNDLADRGLLSPDAVAEFVDLGDRRPGPSLPAPTERTLALLALSNSSKS